MERERAGWKNEASETAPVELQSWTGERRMACALRGLPVDRPPVWLMRQAGRALPEYRALKERYSFLELVQTPELATEVTLQPIRRFGFDSAILFSDILVVCQALGQPFQFREGRGIEMEFPIRTKEDVARLEPERIEERLGYVADTLRSIRRELDGTAALLGFAGAPWTLANFMVEGGSAREFTRARRLFYTEPAVFGELMERLTEAVISYLKLQIGAGAEGVQIFDTLGGLLGGEAFEAASGRWIRTIVRELGDSCPVIVFAKGVHEQWTTLATLGAQVLGVDWTVRLSEVKARLPATVGVQGNLDPAVLSTNPGVVAIQTRRLLEEMRGVTGYIFNLGHGVPPTAGLENLEALVSTIQDFS